MYFHGKIYFLGQIVFVVVSKNYFGVAKPLTSQSTQKPIYRKYTGLMDDIHPYYIIPVPSTFFFFFFRSPPPSSPSPSLTPSCPRYTLVTKKKTPKSEQANKSTSSAPLLLESHRSLPLFLVLPSLNETRSEKKKKSAGDCDIFECL